MRCPVIGSTNEKRVRLHDVFGSLYEAVYGCYRRRNFNGCLLPRNVALQQCLAGANPPVSSRADELLRIYDTHRATPERSFELDCRLRLSQWE
jgi:hypothetical protein